MFRKLRIRLGLLFALLGLAGTAGAAFHLWEISEVYSNASGTVQFVEFQTTYGGQQFLALHTLTSTDGVTTNTLTFPAALPGDSTNKKFLVGTTGFAALGIVTPDYTVPNGFLFTAGGTLNFAGVDIFVHGALPTDGSLSLNRNFVDPISNPGGAHTITTSVNSPTNFAGQAGTIVPPAPPGAPTIGNAIPGPGQASIFFTPPASAGTSPITGYTATCMPNGFSAPGPISPITVMGLADGTAYLCSVAATNSAGTGASSATVGITPSASAPLALVSVVSRKAHVGVGTFDLPVDATAPVAGAITVEPRAIGASHSIAFQFNRLVTSSGTVSATSGAGLPVGSPVAVMAGNAVTIDLAAIPDNTRVTVGLEDVNGAGVHVYAPVGFLVGDVNGSRSVTAADILQVKGRSGQVAAASNFQFDLNTSGSVTAADILAVKGRSGSALPAPLTLGGTVSGLAGAVVLQNNGAGRYTVTANGTFAFPAAVAGGAAYNVTVSRQPAGQECTVASGSGTVAASSVANILVTCAATSSGTEYFLTLPHHLCVSQPVQCPDIPTVNVHIAARSATSGQVVFNGTTTPFAVAAGGETILSLPTTAVLVSNETVESKAIHVTALDPVSVQLIVKSNFTTDGTLAFPVASLGTDHYVLSYVAITGAGSSFAVAAAQDNTQVTITPTAAGATQPAGLPFVVVLNAGQTYQFSNPSFADLTGSQVSSDKPVAVFSGHACARVPAGTNYCDYLFEQVPDVARLGKKHHVGLFGGRPRFTVRVVATVDGTIMTYDPPVAFAPTFANRGSYVEVTATSPIQITSTAPVLVAQYMRGAADDANVSGGDPSMVFVTPEEQGVTDATFSVRDLGGASGGLLNLVTSTAAIAGLQLDGAPLVATFNAIGASGYSVATLALAAGAHRLQGTAPFTGVVYDYGTLPVNNTAFTWALPRRFGVLPP